MMRLIQSRYYVPNNSALVVTGDVQAADVYKTAQEFFGEWPRREKDPFVEFPLVEHPPLPKSEGSIIKQPVTNVIMEIGWQGPSIGKDNAATYAADVFSFIMQQPDSRFQRNLVDSGLVNGVAIGYYTQRNVGRRRLRTKRRQRYAPSTMRLLTSMTRTITPMSNSRAPRPCSKPTIFIRARSSTSTLRRSASGGHRPASIISAAI